MRKVCWMFVNPGVKNGMIRQDMVYTENDDVMITIGVDSYERAAEEAKKLVEEGISFLELCAGFGFRGVAMVKEAVDGATHVGVVTFDFHPAMDNQSGDVKFLGAKG